MRQSSARCMIALILFSGILLSAQPQSGQPKLKPVIRQVDHVLIQSSDPKSLFDFLAQTLQLPVAWPVADYSGFVSGGVGAGNVNIEVLRFADQKGPAAGRQAEARFIGLAFEPYRLADCLRELQARGIEHGPPEAYVATLPGGTRGTLWTNVVLPQLSRPGLSVFLCEYNSAFLHAEIRRNQLGGQLVLKQGGPLGIKSVGEIVVGARSPAKDSSDWQRLLSPSAQSPATLWQAGRGPSIRMVADASDRIRRIVFKVESLKAARGFLAENQLLGTVSPGEVAINPRRIQGLSICLAEK
jgi:hypothetical protein